MKDLGFEPIDFHYPEKTVSSGLIKNYTNHRNFPSIPGTSKLGIHFRFGTISIREKLQKALHMNETFVNELIWRDFYLQILWHFPHVVEQSFKPQYDRIQWRNEESEFEKWKTGNTGYPIVDAGMRQLWRIGWPGAPVLVITKNGPDGNALYRLADPKCKTWNKVGDMKLVPWPDAGN